MNRKSIAITLAAAFFALPSLTQASLTTTVDGTITAIYGSGNPNIWDQVVTDTDHNIQLGLNQHVNPNTGTANVNFSINVNFDGNASTTLKNAGYSYWLVVNGTDVNLSSIWDNSFGTSATLNGQGKEKIWFFQPTGSTIFQNSEPWAGLNVTPDTFSLEVRNNGGNVITKNQIPSEEQIVSAVPEPSTVVAGALLLLPFGASALRKLRKSRKA